MISIYDSEANLKITIGHLGYPVTIENGSHILKLNQHQAYVLYKVLKMYTPLNEI